MARLAPAPQQPGQRLTVPAAPSQTAREGSSLGSCRRLICKRQPRPTSPGPRRLVNFGGKAGRPRTLGTKPTRAPHRSRHRQPTAAPRSPGTAVGLNAAPSVAPWRLPPSCPGLCAPSRQGTHKEARFRDRRSTRPGSEKHPHDAKRGAFTTWACGVAPAIVYRLTGVSPRKLTERKVTVKLQSKPVVKIRTRA